MFLMRLYNGILPLKLPSVSILSIRAGTRHPLNNDDKKQMTKVEQNKQPKPESQNRQAYIDMSGFKKQFIILLLLAVTFIGCTGQTTSIPFISEPAVLTPSPTPSPIPSPSFVEIITTRTAADNELLPYAEIEPNPDEAILDIGIVSGPLQTLDPQKTADEDIRELASNLFPGLTRFNLLTKEIELYLAKGWTVSEDGLTWTFSLRNDIYWVRPIASAGLIPILPGSIGIAGVEALRPVFAEDIVFAVRRACDPSTGTPDPIPLFLITGCEAVNTLESATDADLTMIGVSAPDSETVQFQLVAPSSAFLTITSMPQMLALPVDVITEAEANFEEWTQSTDREMVSAGPFVLSPASTFDEKITLEKNPLWPFGFAGNITQVNLFLFDDGVSAWNSWERKELDLIQVPFSLQEQILSENRPKVVEVTDTSVFFLVFNHESEIFRIPELRRAFSTAINREEIIDEVYNSQGYPLRHLTPPGAYGSPPETQVGVGYNPDLGRLSLAAGGVTACRFLPVIRYAVSSSDTSLFQAELVREMWEKELGCPEEKIIIEQVPFGELLARTQPDAGILRPDVWDLGWTGFYPDSHDWFFENIYCHGGNNRLKRPCTNIDNDILRAAESDPAIRTSLYRNIEADLFGEKGLYPIAPIYGEMRYYLRQTWLFLSPDTALDQHNDMLLRYYDLYTINQELKEIEQRQ
ncbi:MAG: oligopeptide transport system substrate-binding protein [Cellvibrionaceae bacterium]|jgi:oligopeptide transport system substrate-binding protein